MADRDEAPPITACKLYEKTSKAGNIYLTGRLGGLRVLIFKNSRVSRRRGNAHLGAKAGAGGTL